MVAPQTVLKRIYFLLPLAYPPNNQSPPGINGAPNRSGVSDWSYDNTQNWSREYPKCSGNRQSPIHIKSSTTYVPPLSPIKFSNYEIPLSGNITLSNNGHSVEFEVPPTVNGRRAFISGSTLKSKYEAASLHFHWGSGGSKGSEHVIDNRRFDAEMHIVHKNVNYATMAEATKHSDGLAVLAVMFKITRIIDRVYPGLNQIFQKLPYVAHHKSSVSLERRITLGHMLGDLNTKKFYTYSGSLTTPDCSEALTWLVFPEPLPIAYEHMQKFWSIKDDRGRPLINNFRPVQARNGRPVLYRAGVNQVIG